METLRWADFSALFRIGVLLESVGIFKGAVMKSLADLLILCGDDEFIDLGDRTIRKEVLEKHMAHVKEVSANFKSPVSWERSDKGFRRKEGKK